MGMGPMGGMPPQMMQQLMQAIAARQQQSQPQSGGQSGGPQAGPPQVPGGGGQMNPPQVGGSSPQMPQFQTGRSTMMLPGGTASPSIPGVPASATPPGSKPKLTGTGLMGTVMAVKQQMQNNKVQKARQLASQYIALKQNDDPKVQKLADIMMQDPKVHKIFDKAVTDPNSAEYQGVQMAYRDQRSEEQQKVGMQEMQAKMEEQRGRAAQQQALAEQETQRARLLGKKADTAGEVTAEDKFKAEQRMIQVTAAINGRLQQTQQTTQRMIEATKMRIEGATKVAGIRAGATLGAARTRASATNNYILQEYKALNAQLTDLDRTSTALSAQLGKDSHWYGDDDAKADVQSKLSQIEAQRAVLTQQFQLLQAKDQAFQRSGLTAPLAPVGTGTAADPIVIP